MPVVAEVQGPVSLLTRDWPRDHQRSGGLMAKCGALVIAVSQSEIGKIFAVVTRSGNVDCSHHDRRSGRPRSGKGAESAAGVGLQVVIVALFELATPDEGVAAPDHCDLRGDIEMGVWVVNRALTLACGNPRD